MTQQEWQRYWDRRESMTEEDWRACRAARPLLVFARTWASDRKIKLFEAACCRRIWDRLGPVARRDVVEWERFAEGELVRDELADFEIHSDPNAGEIAWDDATNGAEEAQTELIHDVFGNPFRPVAFLPEWRTSTAIALAAQMYESRDFGAMPILADALQDAGCDNADMLNHCRGEGPHVRGCWVVDLLLGRLGPAAPDTAP